ncbi:putative strictosidine synthase transcription factor WD40-like family [Helianthus annuus]|nr:putative strictosidine synthase transcription factor WD40-like family [Helianthus annuus]
MAKLTEISKANTTRKDTNSWGMSILFVTLAVIAIAVLVIQLDTFETVAYPMHELGKPMVVAATNNAANLPSLEKIGSGELIGPEDIAYDPKSGYVYTGCDEGWIKRVKLNDSAADTVVENWVNTGGRPLGISVADSGDIFVADAFKGLLKVSVDGELEVLAVEAEGMKLGFPDGVVVAKNGMVYFTDGSYKHGYYDSMPNLMEGRPDGRFLSYDPLTKQTQVIARDLYFANGVELSPNQDFVIYCESFMMRCHRYYLEGEKKGSIDVFVDGLPGYPDNLRYDGEGHYWLAIAWDYSISTHVTMSYPFVRKILAFGLKHLQKMPTLMKFGGVIALDLDGKPIGGYYDDTWTYTTSGLKIGEHLYLGTLVRPYFLRLNLTQNPLISGAL